MVFSRKNVDRLDLSPRVEKVLGLLNDWDVFLSLGRTNCCSREALNATSAAENHQNITSGNGKSVHGHFVFSFKEHANSNEQLTFCRLQPCHYLIRMPARFHHPYLR
jgi:hypothetical protein